MTKRRRTPRVVPSLSVQLVLRRGMDLTAAGILFGLATQHSCAVFVIGPDGPIDVGLILDVVGLNIQPQTTVELRITGAEKTELSNRLSRMCRDRWTVTSISQTGT